MIFRLLVAPLLFACTAALAGEPVNFVVGRDGVRFEVSSPNSDDANTLTIRLSGLSRVNEPYKRAIDGHVGKAEMADLDGDGTRELLVHVFTPGTGQYGDVLAFSTNGNKSLSEISVLHPEAKALAGYMGHDEWIPVKRALVRRFPVYRPGDPNAAPTGGYREIRYELRKGEAVWQLVPVKVRNL